jgi:hypothetical protein
MGCLYAAMGLGSREPRNLTAPRQDTPPMSTPQWGSALASRGTG